MQFYIGEIRKKYPSILMIIIIVIIIIIIVIIIFIQGAHSP